MKMILEHTRRAWLGAFVGMIFFCAMARGGEKTAFELAKEADKHVGEDAKGKVVQLRSEKSIGSLTPTIWYVVMYDPDATAKATEIKFGAGQKLSVKRPERVLELGM